MVDVRGGPTPVGAWAMSLMSDSLSPTSSKCSFTPSRQQHDHVKTTHSKLHRTMYHLFKSIYLHATSKEGMFMRYYPDCRHPPTQPLLEAQADPGQNTQSFSSASTTPVRPRSLSRSRQHTAPSIRISRRCQRSAKMLRLSAFHRQIRPCT